MQLVAFPDRLTERSILPGICPIGSVIFPPTLKPVVLSADCDHWLRRHNNTTSALDDKLNRLTSISAGTTTLATYTYLGQSGIVTTEYPVPGMALDLWGGTTGVFSGLDRFGRTTDHRWQATGSSSIDLDRFRYGYDRNSNPLYRQHYIATDLDELYAYDRFDRLTGMKRGALTSSYTALAATPAIEAAWTLDRLGNWSAYQTKVAGTTDLAQTRTANKVNEIASLTNTTGPTWANIAYDAAGNMTAGPKGQDETTLLKFSYDGWNRLVKVKDATDALIASYAYDGTGRRIKKTPGFSARNAEYTYYNASYQAVEVRMSLAVTEQTVFDPKYVDAVIVRYRNTNPKSTGLDETLFFTHDRMFNVTGVWDATQTAIERYRYTPYGERTVLDATFLGKTGNASTVDQRRGHQGLVLYGETRVYYNCDRNFISTLGVFNARDPLGADHEDGMNLYQYLASSPAKYMDPSGRSIFGRIVTDGKGSIEPKLYDKIKEMSIPCVRNIVEAHEKVHVTDYLKQYPNIGKIGNVPTGKNRMPGRIISRPSKVDKDEWTAFEEQSERNAWSGTLSRIKNIISTKCTPCQEITTDDGDVINAGIVTPEMGDGCCDWAMSIFEKAERLSKTGKYQEGDK